MRRAVVALALLTTLFAGLAGATVIRRLTLGEVEACADRAFVGTVLGKRCLAGDPGEEPIVTEVTFGDLTALKGDFRRATVSFRFAGGTLGDRTLRIVGMPEFEKGRRYVLFTADGLDRYCPAVGWWQGRYTVLPAASGGEDLLADSDGRPVYAFEGGVPVIERIRGKSGPMELRAFLDLVRETSRKRKLREGGGR